MNPPQGGAAAATPDAPVVELGTLKDMSVTELTHIARQLDVPGATGMRKQELIFEILKSRAEKSGLLFSEGMTLGSGPFGTTYFTLTGFHGAHVFGGVLMLGVILYRGMAGQFSSKHHDAVEAVSLYWHFVDVVWILLFSILYLIP